MKPIQTIKHADLDAQLQHSLEIAQMVRLSSEEVEAVSGGQANNGPTTGFVPRRPATGFVPKN